MRQMFTCAIPNEEKHTLEKYQRMISESASEMGFIHTDGFKVVPYKDPLTGEKKLRLDAAFNT